MQAFNRWAAPARHRFRCTPGIYHWASRCECHPFLQRQAPLKCCSFEHRSKWPETRLPALASTFTAAMHAFVVTRNRTLVALGTEVAAPRASCTTLHTP